MADREELSDGALELALGDLIRQRLVTEVKPADPGAGNELATAVPAGQVWELLGVAYRLTTSAAVANRSSALAVKDPDGLLVAQVDPPAVQAAGAAKDYAWMQGVGAAVAGAVNESYLPGQGIPLGPGFVITTVTAAIDAGDAYTRAVLMVRAWSVSSAIAARNWICKNFRQ